MSWQGYLLLAPIGFIWIFTTVPEAFATSTGWLAGIFVAVTSYLVTGVILGVASVTVLKGRSEQPAPIAVVMVVGAAAWGARSGYLAWFLWAFDLPSQAGAATRVITGSLLGVVIVPATAWGLALLDDFRVTRRRLLDELVAQEVRARNASTYIDAMRDTVIGQVSDAVDREFERIEQSDSDGPSAVDQLAKRMSRDLPRELWKDARRQATLTPSLVMKAAARRPLAAWPLIPMAILGSLVMIRFLPISSTIAAMGAALVWGALIVVVVNRWAAKSRGAASLIVATLGMLTSGAVVATALTLMDADIADRVAFTAMVAFTFTLFSLGGGLAHALNVTEKSVLAQLTSSITQAEVQAEVLEREEARLRREIATTLHGTVGANLTAASMRLRTAIDAGEPIVAVNALHEARRLVDVELANVQIEALADPQVLVEHIAESWSGLVTITAEVTCSRQLDAATMRALDDVVTEGINNAVRHAHARIITVRISERDPGLRIEVIDDGHRRQESSPGLGSRIFDEIAPGRWSLIAGPAGSTLSVDVVVGERA